MLPNLMNNASFSSSWNKPPNKDHLRWLFLPRGFNLMMPLSKDVIQCDEWCQVFSSFFKHDIQWVCCFSLAIITWSKKLMWQHSTQIYLRNIFEVWGYIWSIEKEQLHGFKVPCTYYNRFQNKKLKLNNLGCEENTVIMID